MLDFSIDKLQIETIAGRKFDIHIPSKVNIILGNSGTGKTYMVSEINELKQDTNLVTHSTVDLDDIVIWDGNITPDTSISGKLVIADRYGFIETPEYDEFIKSSDNKFILMIQNRLKDLRVPIQHAYILQYHPLERLFKTDAYFDVRFGGTNREKMCRDMGWR